MLETEEISGFIFVRFPDGTTVKASGLASESYFELEAPPGMIDDIALKLIRKDLLKRDSITRCAVFRDFNGGMLAVEFTRDGRATAEILINDALRFADAIVRSMANLAFSRLSTTVESCKFSVDRDLGQCWDLDLSLNDHEVTLAEIISSTELLAGDISAAAINEDHLPKSFLQNSKPAVLSSLLSGRCEEILGQRESSWLEFKSYLSLGDEKSKVELAQDVARFANSESGGFICFGYRTERVDGSDVVVKATPFAMPSGIEQVIRNTLDHRIYPPVRGMEAVKTDVEHQRSFMTLIIPPQVDSDKPFLVHGAVVEGKTEGVFFSIVRRRGEDSIPITAREVHSLLSAGYSASRKLEYSYKNDN